MAKSMSIATLLLCALLAGCAHAAPPPSADAIDRLARAFITTLSDEDVATFKRAAHADLPLFHFGAGSRVRHLYFGPGGQGRAALCTPGAYCDIDRESMRIVERAWHILHRAD